MQGTEMKPPGYKSLKTKGTPHQLGKVPDTHKSISHSRQARATASDTRLRHMVSLPE